MKSFSRLAFKAMPPVRPSTITPVRIAHRSNLQPLAFPRTFSHNARLLQNDPNAPGQTSPEEPNEDVQAPKDFIKQQMLSGSRNTQAAPEKRLPSDIYKMPSDIATKSFKASPSMGFQLGMDMLPAKVGPTAGRSVPVDQASGLMGSLARLRYLITSNNVKSDMFKQRFHERPGIRRKRLKSSRHRKRFKKAFDRMVAVILEMKGKGY